MKSLLKNKPPIIPPPELHGPPTQYMVPCTCPRCQTAKHTDPKSVHYRDWETDRKSTRLNSSHSAKSRMPSSA